ncbi:MAG: hypothetical protein V3V97_18920, partial [Hyphomicrobiaceae bacterium]
MAGIGARLFGVVPITVCRCVRARAGIGDIGIARHEAVAQIGFLTHVIGNSHDDRVRESFLRGEFHMRDAAERQRCRLDTTPKRRRDRDDLQSSAKAQHAVRQPDVAVKPDVALVSDRHLKCALVPSFTVRVAGFLDDDIRSAFGARRAEPHGRIVFRY